MNGTRTPHAAGRPRAGFSLVEVALALIVAAGGLLAIFGVFPISLRQSANSRGDMGQMTFASTVLETIAGNIRTIDRRASAVQLSGGTVVLQVGSKTEEYDVASGSLERIYG